MDSGRFLLAVVLMIAVVIVTNILFPPIPPADATGLTGDSTLVTDLTGAPPPTPIAAPPTPVASTPEDPAADPGTAGVGADTVFVSSDLYRFGVSTLGGTIVSVRLAQYASFAAGSAGTEAELQPEGGPGLVRYRLRVGDQVLNLAGLPFRPSATSLDLNPESGPASLTLTHTDSARGLEITLQYRFHPDDYVVDVSGSVQGSAQTPQLHIDIGPTLRSNEAVATEDERTLAYVVSSDLNGIQSQLLSKLRAQHIENGPLAWVALKNKYFLVAAMQSVDQPAPFGGLIAQPTGEPFSANLSATLLATNDGRFAYRLYAGPREGDRLAAFGNELQDVSVFGWRFLQPILRPLGHAITWAVKRMHIGLGIGYGWVLILFGFLIRFVLWPLNAKAMRSQLKQMELQPRLKEMQARYKSDPQKLQQEMLKMYKEEGFNPMGGCLPMLLPLPVLITLFFVFQSTIEFRGVPFLWLPDLATKDPLYILPVLLGLSMFIQQFLNMRATKDAPAQMKYLTYIMPVFLTFIFLNFASGLNLYYASMNIASVPQQLQIMKEKKRRMGGAKPPSK